MKRLHGPERLADATAPNASALAQALRATRVDGSRAQLERLAQRLAPQLNVPATPATVVTSTTAPSTVTKLGTAVLAALIAAALMLHVGRERAAPRAVDRARAQPAIARSSPPASAAVTAAQAAPPPPPVAPAPRDPAVERGARKPRASRTTAPAAAQPSPEAELSLLQRSQLALDRAPASALVLAEQHARDYPQGVFAQEREMLAIEALLKLRDQRAAVVRAERFVQRFPDSAHVRRVRALLERARVRTGAAIPRTASDSSAAHQP